MPSELGKLTQSAMDGIADRAAKDVPLRFASSNEWASRHTMEDAKPKFLKARFQIGSCKGPSTFKAGEHVFHPDDIPAAKMKNKHDT